MSEETEPSPTEKAATSSSQQDNVMALGVALVVFLSVIVIAFFIKTQSHGDEAERLRQENHHLSGGPSSSPDASSSNSKLEAEISELKKSLSQLNIEKQALEEQLKQYRDQSAELSIIKSKLESARELLKIAQAQILESAKSNE